MRKVYLDQCQLTGCVGVFMHDAEVIPAGTTIYAMPVKDKNSEYERYASEYDMHFIFDDALPKVDFYTVPQVEIIATDSRGGYLGSLGGGFNRESKVCYIDRDRNCFLSSRSGGELLKKPEEWQSTLSLCDCVELFRSAEEARAKYEFLDVTDLLNSLPKE